MLFRRDDSMPLDLQEEEDWFVMQSIGRGRYVARRTASALANTLLPIALSVWGLWAAVPNARPYLFGPFTWVPLAVGSVVVGSLAAVHAWDTWRSYEKRSQLEDVFRPMEEAARLSARSLRFGALAAVLSPLALAFMVKGQAPAFMLVVMGVAVLTSWRSLFRGWRARQAIHNTFKEIEE